MKVIESKKISNKLPIIGVVFILIVIIGLITMKSPKHRYRLSTEEMLTKTMEHDYIIKYDKFFDIYHNNDSLYRFIDLRSAHDYQISHLKGAINIPLSKILDTKYMDIVNQDEKINVFYASDQLGACAPWMILTQLGYKNNFVLGGGFGYVTEHIIKEYSPMLGNFLDEKAKYDYKEIISNTAGGASASSSSNVSDAPAPIIKKKASKEEEGGC